MFRKNNCNVIRDNKVRTLDFVIVSYQSFVLILYI
ncbi:hypothetical protein BVRB_9g209440 [Beta vulgaris subsp. vulgaris]|nr:hypothetical protein BVRB_9g209440 [Beta vulgaris subsp. vulgaris]